MNYSDVLTLSTALSNRIYYFANKFTIFSNPFKFNFLTENFDNHVFQVILQLQMLLTVNNMRHFIFFSDTLWIYQLKY